MQNLKIEKYIEITRMVTRVSNMFQEDGGDIIYAGFDDGVVKLRM